MDSTKKKKWLIAFSILLACSITCAFSFFTFQPQLVTGKKADLLQIVIKERFPGEGGGREGEPKSKVVISDIKTLYAIYSLPQRARPIKETRGEMFYTMVNPRYELTLKALW